MISCNSVGLFQALLLAVVLVTGSVVAKDCLDWLSQISFFLGGKKAKFFFLFKKKKVKRTGTKNVYREWITAEVFCIPDVFQGLIKAGYYGDVMWV